MVAPVPRRVLALLYFGWALLGAATHARGAVIESLHTTFCLDTVESGLVYPVSAVFASEQLALVAERVGRIHTLNPLTGQTRKVAGIPTSSGLLDLAVHPDFQNNHWLYISYALRVNGQLEFRVARGVLHATTLAEVTTVFSSAPGVTEGRYGGALLFLPDNTLLLSISDRDGADDAQDLSSYLGKILRLQDTEGRQAFPAIFSHGHRSVQGLALDAANTIWATEHGPKGGDELNEIAAGGNYGWPLSSFGTTYDGDSIGDGTQKPGLRQPAVHWQETLAPSGLMVYTGRQFAKWHGDFFIAALAGRQLRRLRMQGGVKQEEEVLLREMNERIRDVTSDPAGNIYVLTDGAHGQLWRLSSCE